MDPLETANILSENPRLAGYPPWIFDTKYLILLKIEMLIIKMLIRNVNFVKKKCKAVN